MEQESLRQAKNQTVNARTAAPKSQTAKTKTTKNTKTLVEKKPASGVKNKKPVKEKSQNADNTPFVKVSPAVAKTIMDRLCDLYPDADCELTFATPFQLLIATILSAQTTDVQVNKVTKQLFARFPDPKALAEADLDEVKEIIKPTGYYNAKAKNIQDCAQALVLRFKSKVPPVLEDLVTLPGVGRKTANVVLGEAFEIPGWTVDTHVQRLARRLGFTDQTDPYKIELALQQLFPKSNWSRLSITLIWHGRRMCYARKPECPKCPVASLCPSSSV
jgi:endonuclease III